MPHMRFYKEGPLVEGSAVIRSQEVKHIYVMRPDIGDEIELINGDGSLAIATIRQLEKKEIVVQIEEVMHEKRPVHSFTLFQAMPKMPHLNLIVEKCCELGVDEIALFESSHSEKKGLSDSQLERLNHLLIASIKQCGRLYKPLIRLAQLNEATGATFYGDLETDKSPPQLDESVSFVNGPEKGFSDADFKVLKELGAKGISLSKNVLRTETAAIAATALFCQ